MLEKIRLMKLEREKKRKGKMEDQVRQKAQEDEVKRLAEKLQHKTEL